MSSETFDFTVLPVVTVRKLQYMKFFFGLYGTYAYRKAHPV